MENLVEVSVNLMLNKIMDTAICEAIRLQLQANEEFEKQKLKEMAEEPYSYMAVHAFRDGVRAMCNVLQKMFGGFPADCIQAIEKIVKSNRNDECLGYDSRDYVKLFRETLEEK